MSHPLLHPFSMIIRQHRVPLPLRYRPMAISIVSCLDDSGLHADVPWLIGLWIMAAKFELEVMVSPSSARVLFQRALRIMPQEKKLWVEVSTFACKIRGQSLLIRFRLISISSSNCSTWNWCKNVKLYWIARQKTWKTGKKTLSCRGKLSKSSFTMLKPRLTVRTVCCECSTRNIRFAFSLDNPEFLCSFVRILYEFSQLSFIESLVDQIYQV